MAGTDLYKPLESECPSCRKKIKRYLYSQANYVGCSSCGAWFTLLSDNRLKQTNVKVKGWLKHDTFAMPGSKAKLEKVEYIITGVVKKCELSAPQYTWKEYTLFNPEKGYCWMSEFDGHWLILENVLVPGSKFHGSLEFRDKTFRLFQISRSKTISAIGEFADNVYNTANYKEYISPPYFLSNEKGSSYSEWYLGTYVSKKDVAEMLGVDDKTLPEQFGVGAAQPSPFSGSNGVLKKFAILTAIILILFSFIYSSIYPSRHLVSVSGMCQDSAVHVSPFFIVKEHTTDLYFSFSGSVNNSWSDADILLINDDNGEARGLTLGAEYYSGVEDGESWSEGSTTSDAYLSCVKPGVYHINVKSSYGATSGTVGNFDLNVSQNDTITSNVVIALLLICLIPTYSMIRERSFERSRWSNSDYSPYYTASDDE